MKRRISVPPFYALLICRKSLVEDVNSIRYVMGACTITGEGNMEFGEKGVGAGEGENWKGILK